MFWKTRYDPGYMERIDAAAVADRVGEEELVGCLSVDENGCILLADDLLQGRQEPFHLPAHPGIRIPQTGDPHLLAFGEIRELPLEHVGDAGIAGNHLSDIDPVTRPVPEPEELAVSSPEIPELARGLDCSEPLESGCPEPAQMAGHIAGPRVAAPVGVPFHHQPAVGPADGLLVSREQVVSPGLGDMQDLVCGPAHLRQSISSC